MLAVKGSPTYHQNEIQFNFYSFIEYRKNRRFLTVYTEKEISVFAEILMVSIFQDMLVFMATGRI